MKLIRAGAAVLNQIPLDWTGNRARIVAAIHEAQRRGVTLLCLPELCATGYGCEDAFHAPDVHRRALAMLLELAPCTHGMFVTVGLPIAYRHAVFNAVACLVDGKVQGLVAKQYLAGDGVHYEPRWFKAWEPGVVTTFDWNGQSIPLGDLVFECDGIRIGLEICEDAWVAGRPGVELSRRGVDVVLNPSASHFAFGKHEVRERIVLEASRSMGVAYVYSNLLGNEAGRIIYDGDALIASGGALLARGPRFSFADYVVSDAIVDLDVTRLARARSVSYSPSLAPDPGCRKLTFAWPVLAHAENKVVSAHWLRTHDEKCEEFTRALALGLFDYLRKSGAKGFVISLSGGCDSGVIAALVYYAFALALQELGPAGLVRRCPALPAPVNRADVHAWVSSILLTVYQGTRNSSETTRNAAQMLAQAIGATHRELDIDGLVETYRHLVEPAIGRTLNWEHDDIALQNIQARVRGPSAWFLANLRGALLLATSNRSEAAVGYTTMDGDTCGSISPIAGVDKVFLRHYLGWLEKQGPLGIGPLPCVQAILTQEPTAELRPAQRHQTDESDLMPYAVLDAIERAAIRDREAPLAAFQQLRTKFPEHQPAQLGQYVERFYQLWCRNQWKRERYAPAFHLDDENLDPKTWCRFPILSAGFAEELAELRGFVAGLGG
jgi:NAD+ synthase (glutamine-hydrolysing)